MNRIVFFLVLISVNICTAVNDVEFLNPFEGIADKVVTCSLYNNFQLYEFYLHNSEDSIDLSSGVTVDSSETVYWQKLSSGCIQTDSDCPVLDYLCWEDLDESPYDLVKNFNETAQYRLIIYKQNGAFKIFYFNVLKLRTSLLLEDSFTKTNCFGDDNAVLSVDINQDDFLDNEGIGDYTYELFKGDESVVAPQDSDVFYGLSSGEYFIRVYKNGIYLTDTDVSNITEPPAINSTYTVSNISCSGYNDGIVTIITEGGTENGNYTYAIDSDPGRFYIGKTFANGDKGFVFDSLGQGTYTVTVLDDNGCSNIIEFLVEEPDEIVITNVGDVAQQICDGGTAPSAEIMISGGSPPYTILLNGIEHTSYTKSGSSYLLMDLPIDNKDIFIVVADSNRCLNILLDPLVVLEPISLGLDVVLLEECGSPTIINASVSSDYENEVVYSIIDSSGDTVANNPPNLDGNFVVSSSGDYVIYVEHTINGCMSTKEFKIGQNYLSINSIIQTASGNTPSGSIEFPITDDNEAYSYSINDGLDFKDSNVFYDLEAGNYTVIVKDSNECSLEPFTVNIEQVAIDNSVSISSDDILEVAYKKASSYQWINIDTGERILDATNYTFVPPVAGNYQVEMIISNAEITLAKGISAKEEDKVVLSPITNFTSASLSTNDILDDVIEVYPNPAKSYINVPYTLLGETFQILDVTGKKIKKGNIEEARIDILELNNGFYFLQVEGYSIVKFLKE